MARGPGARQSFGADVSPAPRERSRVQRLSRGAGPGQARPPEQGAHSTGPLRGGGHRVRGLCPGTETAKETHKARRHPGPPCAVAGPLSLHSWGRASEGGHHWSTWQLARAPVTRQVPRHARRPTAAGTNTRVSDFNFECPPQFISHYPKPWESAGLTFNNAPTTSKHGPSTQTSLQTLKVAHYCKNPS